jgi:hypothetical protein
VFSVAWLGRRVKNRKTPLQEEGHHHDLYSTLYSICAMNRLNRFARISIPTLFVGRGVSSFAEGKTSPKTHYDLLVIGGGSGGLACAKRSAGYGASVGIIEGARYGGTCVNVGCVPKKVMYNAAHVAETIHEAKNFGYHTLSVLHIVMNTCCQI